MNNNTIAGFHVKSNKDGIIKLHTKKMYYWHIPKSLRKEPIQQGDIVLVRAANGTAKGLTAVLVMQVFREEFEETQKRYKRVVKIIERAPKREAVNH